MSISITYRLPPNIERVPNPHYREGPEQYAPYKLIDRGAYPMGFYTVSGVDPYSGRFRAVKTTNDSVTLLYRSIPPTPFPKRSQLLPTEVWDVNQYAFAVKPYDKGNDVWHGISNERHYDPAIFDFDSYEGQDTAVINTLESVTDVIHTIEFADRVYGYAIVRLDQLPGFKKMPDGNLWYAGDDPNAVTLPAETMNEAVLGRYLVVISNFIRNDPVDIGNEADERHEEIPDENWDDFNYSIYPPLPDNLDVSITWTHLDVENTANLTTVVGGHPIFSGSRLIVRYSSLYTAQTGPGFSKIYPYHNQLPTKYKPAIITLPVDNSCNLPYRFYQGATEAPFDLHKGLDFPPLGATVLPDNTVPGSLLSISGTRI
jgi:hypothetical protein